MKNFGPQVYFSNFPSKFSAKQANTTAKTFETGTLTGFTQSWYNEEVDTEWGDDGYLRSKSYANPRGLSTIFYFTLLPPLPNDLCVLLFPIYP